MKEFNLYYQPFRKKNEFNKRKIFGVFVLLEDNYIYRKEIYDRTAELLKLSVKSDEMDYIQANIKIVGLREIEYNTINPNDYSKNLLYNSEHKSNWTDFTINDENMYTDRQKSKRLRSFNSHISYLQSLIDDIARELFERGIID